MSQSKADKKNQDAKKDREVADYLKSQPRFFVRHADLLANLEVPLQAGEAPFHERQVQVLRDRDVRQQARLALMVDTVRSNQNLAHELHRIAIKLLVAEAREVASLSALAALVKERFELEAAAIFLSSQQQELLPQVDYSLLCQRVAHLSSVCDDRVSSQLMTALFPQASALASGAFVPLVHRQDLRGVLVLGSADERRFRPDMGVLLIDRLGQLLGAHIAARNLV